jgi:hypothetical protein
MATSQASDHQTVRLQCEMLLEHSAFVLSVMEVMSVLMFHLTRTYINNNRFVTMAYYCNYHSPSSPLLFKTGWIMFVPYRKQYR